MWYIALQVPYGLAVRIPGSHPGGPGSTPGVGRIILRFLPAFVAILRCQTIGAARPSLLRVVIT